VGLSPVKLHQYPALTVVVFYVTFANHKALNYFSVQFGTIVLCPKVKSLQQILH
jgi:hypothetical protein